MVIQITLCVLLILGFAWLLWMLGCALLTPVRSAASLRLRCISRRRFFRLSAMTEFISGIKS